MPSNPRQAFQLFTHMLSKKQKSPSVRLLCASLCVVRLMKAHLTIVEAVQSAVFDQQLWIWGGMPQLCAQPYAHARPTIQTANSGPAPGCHRRHQSSAPPSSIISISLSVSTRDCDSLVPRSLPAYQGPSV